MGDSRDEQFVGKNAYDFDLGAILNVAQDLRSTCGWAEVRYYHCGLVDGPGNPLSAYAAAVLTLHTILERGSCLVCCHDGGRAVAVAMMYLILKRGKVSAHPTFLNHWTSWGKMWEELSDKLGMPIPTPHEAHREAFERLPLSLIEGLT